MAPAPPRLELEPDTPGRASLCVKLVAEPCRILLWLEHGEEHRTRRSILERARTALAEEREAIEEALDLDRRLARSPRPPLDRALPALLRLTQRIAALLTSELEAAGTTPVRLLWDGPEELAVPSQPFAPLLPLADWRSLVAPTLPDECLAPIPRDPADPESLRSAARAGSPVVYAALRAGDVLVLPPSEVYWLGKYRCAHFPASDPVSFALLAGSDVAGFPDHPGWSIADVAARAVAEHAAYLEAQLHEPEWEVAKLGRLLSAARAALLAEGVAAGEPVLPLTVAATARALDEPLLADAAAVYRLHRTEGGPPLDSLLAELEPLVRGLLRPRADAAAASS